MTGSRQQRLSVRVSGVVLPNRRVPCRLFTTGTFRERNIKRSKCEDDSWSWTSQPRAAISFQFLFVWSSFPQRVSYCFEPATLSKCQLASSESHLCLVNLSLLQCSAPSLVSTTLSRSVFTQCACGSAACFALFLSSFSDYFLCTAQSRYQQRIDVCFNPLRIDPFGFFLQSRCADGDDVMSRCSLRPLVHFCPRRC